MQLEPHLDAIDEGVALRTGEGRGEVTHHLVVGVERRERLPILVAPAPECEPLRRDAVDPAHVADARCSPV